MSAIALLRRETAAAHDAVDRRYAAFDLTDRADYRRFLVAHAHALPAAEAQARTVWPALRTRVPALTADLATLGASLCLATPVMGDVDDAAGWAALYVLEGSRLGGGMLARALPPGAPGAYLSAVHLPGEWRAIRAAVDAAAAGRDAAWHAALVAAAQGVFARYERAADAA